MKGKSVLSLDVNSTDDIFAGTVDAGVYRSTNNGSDWQQINNGLTDLIIFSLTITSSDHIFLISLDGLFRSTNMGNNWQQLGNSLSGTIREVKINSSNGDIVVGTSDGVLRSKDGGDSWTVINSGLTSLNVLSLTVDSNDLILAGTFEKGVFRSVETATSVEEITGRAPTLFSLGQNYPNPFNPTTLIRYHLAASAEVVLTIHNAAGQQIKTLLRRQQTPGPHQIEWDGTNAHGLPAASGVYFYRLKTNRFEQTKKMILLR